MNSNPFAFSDQPLYLVRVPSAKKVYEYVPRVAQNTAKWHFTLEEAMEVKEQYIEKMQEVASRSNNPDELRLIEAMLNGLTIVEYVEN